MQVAQTIRTWHQIGLGEQVDRSDVFFRFIATWVAFNAIYCSRSAAQGCDLERTHDAKHVSGFASDPEVIARHVQLLSVDPEYHSAVHVLADEGVAKLISTRRCSRQNITCVEDAKQVLLCVYQVRCNLFHGQKTPDSGRDRSLVNAAYTILIRIIRPCVDDVDKW
jgi:hypothetical protein